MTDAATQAKIRALEERLRLMADDLAERDEEIRQLRAELRGDGLDLPEWLPPLTSTEAVLFKMLATGRTVTKSGFLQAQYGHTADPPVDTITNVYIHHLRKKIGGRLTIEGRKAQGWRFSSESMKRLRADGVAAQKDAA